MLVMGGVQIMKRERQKEVEQLQKVFNLSEEDSEAMLAQMAEVPTTDPIPLDELKKYTKVDSTATTLNNLHAENPSAILDRNAPRE